ncbi:MAG: hypothetical protein H6923_04735 [Alphaproteobacteria bacterium]|nr:hypothetical protein [Alphaproteobacteria bacterium]
MALNSDGFGTLSTGLVERGSRRAREVLGGGVFARSASHAAHDPWGGHAHRDIDHPRDEGPAIEVEGTTRRAGGANTRITIRTAPGSAMQRVTITMKRVDGEGHETFDAWRGEPFTAITYERRPLDDVLAEETERARRDEDAPLWIETDTYSGPDRRASQVSPEHERRKTVPPRIKIAARYEQERYLRIKLAVQETGRTQQDLLTAAIDSYLDGLGVDRFRAVAMSTRGERADI